MLLSNPRLSVTMIGFKASIDIGLSSKVDIHYQEEDDIFARFRKMLPF